MTRAYIRLDPAFDEHKYDYPDGAYAALVATLCLAEAQPARGRFRSADYLRRLLGKRGRWVPYLLEHHDVVELVDGRVYVDGWDEWQEGDRTVAERVARIRARKGVTPDVTVPVTPDVTADRLDSGAERSGAVTERPTVPIEDDDLPPWVLAFDEGRARQGLKPRPLSEAQRAVIWKIVDAHSPEWVIDIATSPVEDPFRAVLDAHTAWAAPRREVVDAEERAWKRQKRAEAQQARREVARAFAATGGDA